MPSETALARRKRQLIEEANRFGFASNPAQGRGSRLGKNTGGGGFQPAKLPPAPQGGGGGNIDLGALKGIFGGGDTFANATIDSVPGMQAGDTAIPGLGTPFDTPEGPGIAAGGPTGGFRPQMAGDTAIPGLGTPFDTAAGAGIAAGGANAAGGALAGGGGGGILSLLAKIFSI